ncbi:hypothetical protein CGCF415_v009631 [Colletotrichum fructicola]|uniref:Uncharacterized protein n=1 Tax=Colletotrichum fructicola (strain Nara gc5) TaxID=1213859 RepID=A0A7J6ISL2_COLFN|nr:hypothetical protein CGGC5_v011722 [Colletotrichum fructicola Nara gc5]KAF4891633.1 hypothetical protein CGCFRS4_v008050 [Colletotrichum fructicola]KAF4901682.1 hypothetical protein CGCF415_v009631 [Colletotrichum fructicola]KAF4935069.1 hypothetical protein CGCF245_v008011 [Colletotrichum fructicola]
MAANENEPPTPREEQPWSQSQCPTQADTRDATSDNQHRPACPVLPVADEPGFSYASSDSPNLMFPIESFDVLEVDLGQQQTPSHPVQRPLKSLETLMTKLPSHYPHNNQFL